MIGCDSRARLWIRDKSHSQIQKVSAKVQVRKSGSQMVVENQ
jgi:hypothetical protein